MTSQRHRQRRTIILDSSSSESESNMDDEIESESEGVSCKTGARKRCPILIDSSDESENENKIDGGDDGGRSDDDDNDNDNDNDNDDDDDDDGIGALMASMSLGGGGRIKSSGSRGSGGSSSTSGSGSGSGSTSSNNKNDLIQVGSRIRKQRAGPIRSGSNSGSIRSKTVSKRSQLDNINFDSSSEEEEDDDDDDNDDDSIEDSIDYERQSYAHMGGRGRGRGRGNLKTNKTKMATKTIELLDTDEDEEEDESYSDGNSDDGDSDDDDSLSNTRSIREESSFKNSQTRAPSSSKSIDVDGSPKPFTIDLPTPSNSVLSVDSNSDHMEWDEKDVGMKYSSDEESHVVDDLDLDSQASIDDDGNKESAWRLTKRGTYILHGECSMMEGGGSMNLDWQWPKMNIPKKLYDTLYDHQKVGVQWMAALHARGTGGILGDDMGLGKTYQTLTLLGGLFRTKSIARALIIVPVAVLRNWEREARMIVEKSCGIDVEIIQLSSSVAKKKRAIILEDALMCSTSRPHIIITTYGMVSSSTMDFLGGRKDDSLYWDYIVTDEGHTIKNSTTKMHKACARIARSLKTHRLLLSGTPIQNNMKEMWALFDWAASGRLFGTQRTFLNKYAAPIEEGRNRNASDWSLKAAAKANKELQTKLKPHFLQRMKNAEFKDYLPVKKELVVWSHLTDIQREMYEKYVVDGGKVSAILSGEISSPLVAITWLKKLCDHPSLVDDSGIILGRDELIGNSAKLNILVDLVLRLKKSGHRCLIFSPSTKILDIIEKVLESKINMGRIDGSVNGKQRQIIVDQFNDDEKKYEALLISTKAGGVGLTLTGADRAILFSPSWNPADDNQAVDRCYRIGQRKNVTVYRFITAGTVEERMYEKQVHKDGIRRTLVTSSGSATERHFTRDDLRRLFVLGPKGECKMLETIKKATDSGVKGSSGKRSFLETHQQVVGVSSHDLVYQNKVIDLVEPESPFAGTPLKRTTSRMSSLPIKHLTFSELARDHQNSVRNTSNQASTPLCSMTKCDKTTIEEEVSFKPRTSALKAVENPVAQNKDSALLCINNKLNQVQSLTLAGQIDESLSLLFEMVDSPELKGNQKLLVHKKIAARVSYYGWI